MPYKRDSNFENNLPQPLPQAPNSDFLRPLFEPDSSMNPQVEQKAKNFEDKLFENGVYSCHSKQETFRNRLRAQRGSEGEGRADVAWSEVFSGFVPANWNIWGDVMDAFEAAGEAQAQLSPELIYAGLLHPHHLVVKAAGKHQLLSREQLALCFIRYWVDDLPEWNIDQILKAQRRKGIRPADMRQASQLGRKESIITLVEQALEPHLDDIACRQRQRMGSQAEAIVKPKFGTTLREYIQAYL